MSDSNPNYRKGRVDRRFIKAALLTLILTEALKILLLLGITTFEWFTADAAQNTSLLIAINQTLAFTVGLVMFGLLSSIVLVPITYIFFAVFVMFAERWMATPRGAIIGFTASCMLSILIATLIVFPTIALAPIVLFPALYASWRVYRTPKVNKQNQGDR